MLTTFGFMTAAACTSSPSQRNPYLLFIRATAAFDCHLALQATVDPQAMCVMEAGSAEMDMIAGDEPSAPAAATVRATVVQASTVFYDTPATIGMVCLLQVCCACFFARSYK
jgi:hypothetical protein